MSHCSEYLLGFCIRRQLICFLVCSLFSPHHPRVIPSPLDQAEKEAAELMKGGPSEAKCQIDPMLAPPFDTLNALRAYCSCSISSTGDVVNISEAAEEAGLPLAAALAPSLINSDFLKEFCLPLTATMNFRSELCVKANGKYMRFMAGTKNRSHGHPFLITTTLLHLHFLHFHLLLHSFHLLL